MTEENIRIGLGMLDTHHAFWKAVQAVHDDAVEGETLSAITPGLSDSARQFNAGRLAATRDLRDTLNTLVAESRHAATDAGKR